MRPLTLFPAHSFGPDPRSIPLWDLALLSGLTWGLAACDGEPAILHDTGRPSACADGYVADGETCVPEACGRGTWGDLEVDDDSVYVDIAAPEGGDGSEGAPLRSIQAGLDLAGSHGGGLVAVAAGIYGETLELGRDHAGVHLAGRCRELVIQEAGVGDDNTAGIDIGVASGEAWVSGLSVVASNYIGVLVQSGVVRLADCAVDDSASMGIRAVRGVHVLDLDVERCTLTGNEWAAIWAQHAGTEVTVEDTVIRDSVRTSNGKNGLGICVEEGAVLQAERCVLDGNQHVGAYAYDTGTELLLVDTVIRDTQHGGNRCQGMGVYAKEGASCVVQGCLLERNASIGVNARGIGTELVLVDTVIRDTLPDGLDDFGFGLQAYEGAVVSLEGCQLERNGMAGIIVGDEGTEFALTDTTVRDTLPHESGDFGYGIEISGGAMLAARGCVLEHNRVVGLIAIDPGTLVTLQDTVIRDTEPDWNGEFGPGIQAEDGAQLFLDGCTLDGNTTWGIAATEAGTHIEIRDSSVTRTRRTWGERSGAAIGVAADFDATISASGLVARGNEGPGLYTIVRGMIRCDGCALLDNRFAGAATYAAGALEISSSTIAGTREIADTGGGVGVYARQALELGAPTLILTANTISDNTVAGVYLGEAGSYRLEGNTISGSSGVPHGSTTRCGDGIYATIVHAWDGSSGLLLEGNTVSGNTGAGLFLDDAAAMLLDNAWEGNTPDLLVQGESCLEPRDDYGDVPSQDICPAWDLPTCTLEFNQGLFVDTIEPDMLLLGAPAPRRSVGLLPTATPSTPDSASLGRGFDEPPGQSPSSTECYHTLPDAHPPPEVPCAPSPCSRS